MGKKNICNSCGEEMVAILLSVRASAVYDLFQCPKCKLLEAIRNDGR